MYWRPSSRTRRNSQIGSECVQRMSKSTNIERLYVHETVENVIPKEAFVAAFDDLDMPAELVGDDEEFTETDAVVTYRPRPEFLDAAWVHCARAGYDEFDT